MNASHQAASARPAPHLFPKTVAHDFSILFSTEEDETLLLPEATFADFGLPDICAPDAATSIPVSWTDMLPHRDYLVRFAKRKLQDPALAEDAVHDVFEAVMSGRALFGGRAALRSWLTAILKNKIVDVIRQRARYDSTDAAPDDDEAPHIECNMACSSARPDEIAEHRELLGQTLQRISALPKGLRDVMQFRVLQDESSQAVCRRLCITEAALFVRLHRARKQLTC
jgi:RNA polymerase sigma-70 factor, ECF subfamily